MQHLENVAIGEFVMAFDFKKEYKELYMPKNMPSIVDVPKVNYIAVKGCGNPIEHACDMRVGQTFITNGWMKNKKSAMIFCNDGFRPVSFLVEALDKESQ